MRISLTATVYVNIIDYQIRVASSGFGVEDRTDRN